MDGLKYTSLEMAKIFGEPKDPRKPYTLLQTAVCETGSADPSDYVYSFDVLLDTDKVYIVTSSGEVTQENVVPDSPATVTFIDVASPEYYVKLTDLASKKEDVFARKTLTINRAMNAYENYLIINAISGAVQTANQFTLQSGETTFTYDSLIDMLDALQDYGDKFVLIVGSTVAKDIVLWDYQENKYHSLKQALADLGVDIIRVNQTVTIDGASTAVMTATKAYLVATDTEVGKPILFIRKKLNSIAMLGGVISENGEAPERLIITSMNPTVVLSGSKRYFAVGVAGFEEVAIAVANPYALACFTRS
jgi:hypothetical protein